MFEFIVKYWEDKDRETKECRGFVGADSYVNAVNKVVNYCSIPERLGEDIISIYVSESENPLEREEIMDWLCELK